MASLWPFDTQEILYLREVAAGGPIGSLSSGDCQEYPVKIRIFFVPIDFVILDMEVDTKTPLILGRPFLSTANTHIDVGAGEI